MLGEVRVKAIKTWDKLITWTLSSKNYPLQLQESAKQLSYLCKATSLAHFQKNHGYFSIHHPLVGLVTPDGADLVATQQLLEQISQEILDPNQLEFITYEILSKIVAYRHLVKGMELHLPSLDGHSRTYIVDAVIDLWRGMPAFGLVPKEKGVPILLFRGTDLDLRSDKAWASVLSDLDLTGPGLTTFRKARGKLRNWLEKMAKEKEPAQLIGYSLGGVLAFYTLMHEPEWISRTCTSVAFNPPGVAKEVLAIWNAIPESERPPLRLYANRGDFVSQVGFFPSNLWEVSWEGSPNVIASHLTFVSAQPKVTFSEVDTKKENALREKRH